MARALPTNERVARRDFVRPIVVAIVLTIIGELLILFVWGMLLFPSGNIWHKLGWTLTCGVAMGATIGALVNVVVTGRLSGLTAASYAGAIYFVILGICVYICYQTDLSTGYFGAVEAPTLFVLGGLVPAGLTGIAYGYYLHLRL